MKSHTAKGMIVSGTGRGQVHADRRAREAAEYDQQAVREAISRGVPQRLIKLSKDPLLDYELIRRRGMREFVPRFWQAADVGSTPFKPSWAADAICDHLTACFRKEIKRLVICMPPRSGKSTIISAIYPAYIWAFEPEHSTFHIAYDISLVSAFAKQTLEVVRSPLFRQIFPDGATVSRKNVGITEFYNDQGGLRFSTIINGKGTGKGGNTQITDDPSKASVGSYADPKLLSNARENYKGTFSNRTLGDNDEFVRILTAQRVHVNDVPGMAMREMGFESLILPMEFTPKVQWDCMSSLQFRDPRSQAGELLFPNVWSRQALDKLKREMAGSDVNPDEHPYVQGQLNQNPQPAGGTAVEKEHFGIVKSPPWHHPRDCFWFSTVDPNHKGRTQVQSRAAMGLWAYFQGRLYLTDLWMQAVKYPKFKAQFVLRHKKLGPWSQARLMMVEDAANGTPMLDELGVRRESAERKDAKGEWAPRLRAVNPGNRPKLERFVEVSDVIVQGKVSLIEAPWNREYLEEVCSFPGGTHDDLVDVTTMALQVYKKIAGRTNFVELAEKL